MNIKSFDKKNIYFLGIGGIGMSALARYFNAKGFAVAGYDRTATDITKALELEGILIHYHDHPSNIPSSHQDKASTLVIYTPAIPSDHQEFLWMAQLGFEMKKRAQVLGWITQHATGLCIAGTHGKTSTSAMLAHILKQSPVQCNAFLGGISNNYQTNLLLSADSPLTVIEADEYDRSFHQLSPFMAVITSTDPDHLDIYGTEQAYQQSFEHFTSLISPSGALILNKRSQIQPRLQRGVRFYTYALTDQADFYARNIFFSDGEIYFDWVMPQGVVTHIRLGVPIKIHIENAIAAMAVAWLNGVCIEDIVQAIGSFKGTKRRFDIHYKDPKMVYMDDYAHHPDEIRACLTSIRELYPTQKITAIFQPHLYTRTASFYKQFAQELSLADQIILLDIYPAREKPIEGVCSELILEQISKPEKAKMTRTELLDYISKTDQGIILTIGAGDIDQLIPPIIEILTHR